ncbi:MAG: oligosaccharide flippase family protein, partial [Planctomycetota bacterium]
MNTTSADVRDEVAPSRPPSVAIRLASGGLPARAEAPFREDLAWSIAASILYALSQAASIVVLVKFTSAADVGQWGLGFAIATPAFLLANLYLRTVQASDASGEFDLADHLGLRLVTTCVATVALVAGTVAWSGSLHAAAVILIVVLIKAVDAVCDILCGHFFQRAAVKAAAVTMLVNAVTSWVALSVAVIASGSVVLGAAGSLVGSCVALAYAARVVAANYGAAALVPRFGLETMRRLATRAAPLGLAGMRSSLHASVPRVAVAYALGEAAVGLFTALSAAAALGGFLTVPVAQAALPRLARARAAGDSRAFRLL